MTNIDILDEIKSKDYKNDKKDKNDKKIDSEKKQKNDISNVKFANMTNKNHLNMQAYLLTRRLTTFYEEA
jgi:hypothetical protein